MTSAAHQQRTRWVALVAAAALSMPGLVACAPLFTHPVPAELKDYAAQLRRDVEPLDDVAAVDVDVAEVDGKDHPGNWYFILRVQATDADSIGVVPDELRPVLTRSRAGGRRVVLQLRIPGGPGVSPSSLGSLSPEYVEAVSEMRELAGVLEVNGALVAPDLFLVMEPDSSIVDSVALIGQHLPLHGEPQVATAAWEKGDGFPTASVDVTASWPAPEIASAVKELMAHAGVRRVGATHEIGTTGIAQLTIAMADTATRADACDVAALLAAIPVDAAVVGPTRFRVDGTTEIVGAIGEPRP